MLNHEDIVVLFFFCVLVLASLFSVFNATYYSSTPLIHTTSNAKHP